MFADETRPFLQGARLTVCHPGGAQVYRLAVPGDENRARERVVRYTPGDEGVDPGAEKVGLRESLRKSRRSDSGERAEKKQQAGHAGCLQKRGV